MPEFNQFRLGDSMAKGQELAMNSLRLGEATRGVQAKQGLSNALQAGTPEAMTEYGNQFPTEAIEYKQQTLKARKEELEGKLFEFGVMEKLMSGVKDEQTYQNARQMMQQAGIDISKSPPNFDPQFVEQQRMQALGVKGRLEMEHRELEKGFKEREVRVSERNAASNERKAAASEKAAGQARLPKVTDTNSVAAGYASRMEEAENIMSQVPSGEQSPGIGESLAGMIPFAGKVSSNAAMSDERQSYRQAQEDWVRSKLRKESGAVIADEEMDREIRVYFPQIGDSEKVVKQKAAAREVALEAMRQASGPAYKPREKKKKIVRTGNVNGRKVVQYEDGTVDYAP